MLGNKCCKPSRRGERLREYLRRHLRKCCFRMPIDELMKIAVQIEDIQNDVYDEVSNNCDPSVPTNTELTVEDLENIASCNGTVVKSSTSQLPGNFNTNRAQIGPSVYQSFTNPRDALGDGTSNSHRTQVPQRRVVTTTCQREEILDYSDRVCRVTTTFGHQVVIDEIQGDQNDDDIDGLMNNNNETYSRGSPGSPTAGPSNINTNVRTIRPLMVEPVTMRMPLRTASSPVSAGVTPRMSGMMQPGCRRRDTRCPRPSKQSFQVEGLELQNKAMSFLGGPDKGITWPQTLEKLGRQDQIYYVSQFMRSMIFKTRLDRKLSGGTAWRNGLTEFQKWVVERVGTTELEDVLRPLPKRRNLAKSKVNCWRDMALQTNRDPD
ncbi:uncharacterized protein LOC127877851 [Dreissena polymorpha]|uniref:uncharacterized protein LOC127877851 n=1 Tax=Dreissena polymorpha TaxID=45954 RepID=UPI002264E18D|nr:uncharacterized protein LOC127877851 [Dreissena polymorpha]XP_052280114.1 uncharacterized protein LOC127877851 [Dreissena polymorpha]XP_052280120.1 uncharacterized protein LOC127877851 [Dreissena polymorpha]